jgi:hypothetical protein
MTDPLGNNANYFTGIGAYPIDSPHYTTIVGEFQNSPSPYGTSDQTGNVWEWNEAIINTAQRGLRGGSFETLAAFVQASHRTQNFPMNEGYDVGFRVVTLIPEPGLLTPLALIGVAMLRRRSATSHAAPGSPAPCASPVMTSLRHGFREVSAKRKATTPTAHAGRSHQSQSIGTVAANSIAE